MKPYSKDGIAEQERAAKPANGAGAPGAQSDAAPEHSDDYYEYELSGVTVHTGSMDRGQCGFTQNCASHGAHKHKPGLQS